jgi:hypothetical protein
MISSLAPFRKLVNPNVGVPCEPPPDMPEKNGSEDGEETRGGMAMSLNCGVFEWTGEDNVGGGGRERVCVEGDKALVEGGGKKESSESGTRLMAEVVPAEIVCAVDACVIVVSESVGVTHSEALLRMRDEFWVLKSGDEWRDGAGRPGRGCWRGLVGTDLAVVAVMLSTGM